MAGGDMLTGHTRLPNQIKNAIRICCREWYRTTNLPAKELAIS